MSGVSSDILIRTEPEAERLESVMALVEVTSCRFVSISGKMPLLHERQQCHLRLRIRQSEVTKIIALYANGTGVRGRFLSGNSKGCGKINPNPLLVG